MTRLLCAVAFLTRVPIRRAFTAEDVGRASVFYPVVGAAIGLAQLGIWRLLADRLSPAVLAVLVVAFSAWITRGLHLDGLADFTDGLGGGRTKDDVLRIMKDSRIGAFGAIALVLVLAAKIAAVAAIDGSVALVAAPALARWSPVALGVVLPYVRSASAPSAHVRAVDAVLATGFAAAACVYADAWIPALGVVGTTLVVGAVARSRLGGVTGDVLGANVELAESVALVGADL